MRVRHREHGHFGHSSSLNMHGLGEMIVYFEDGDASSEYIRDYEFELNTGEWVDFKDPRIQTDDHVERFFEV